MTLGPSGGDDIIQNLRKLLDGQSALSLAFPFPFDMNLCLFGVKL